MFKAVKMYKYISLFYLLFVSIIHVNASTNDSPIVTTASIMQDIVANVAGQGYEIRSIVPIGGDPHIYNPTPGDAQLISKAELVFKNGLTFEGWLNKLIDNSGTQGKIILMTEGIDPIESLKYKNSADPHAWMDVSKAIIYARNTLNALKEWKPEMAEKFQSNFDQYLKDLEELDEWVFDQIETIPPEKKSSDNLS